MSSVKYETMCDQLDKNGGYLIDSHKSAMSRKHPAVKLCSNAMMSLNDLLLYLINVSETERSLTLAS